MRKLNGVIVEPIAIYTIYWKFDDDSLIVSL